MDTNARLRPEKKTSWFPGTLFFFFPPPPLGSKRETLPLASFGGTKRMKRDPRDEIVPESRVGER